MSRRVYVHVAVDVNDVLSEISDDDLLEAVELRELEKGGRPEELDQSALEQIHAALRSRDYEEATLICERLLFPKWPSPKLAAEALQKAKEAA